MVGALKEMSGFCQGYFLRLVCKRIAPFQSPLSKRLYFTLPRHTEWRTRYLSPVTRFNCVKLNHTFGHYGWPKEVWTLSRYFFACQAKMAKMPCHAQNSHHNSVNSTCFVSSETACQDSKLSWKRLTKPQTPLISFHKKIFKYHRINQKKSSLVYFGVWDVDF